MRYLLLALLLLLFAACAPHKGGVGWSTQDPKNDPVNSPHQVDKREELPVCNAGIDGDIWFVRNERTYRNCTSGEWAVL